MRRLVSLLGTVLVIMVACLVCTIPMVIIIGAIFVVFVALPITLFVLLVRFFLKKFKN